MYVDRYSSDTKVVKQKIPPKMIIESRTFLLPILGDDIFKLMSLLKFEAFLFKLGRSFFDFFCSNPSLNVQP